MAACTSPGSNAAPPLRGTSWQVLPQQAPAMSPQAPAEIRLDPDSNRYSGFTGCNRTSGSFELNGQQLRLQVSATTRRACIEESEVEEARFTQALPQVVAWRFVGAELQLLDGAGQPVLRLRAAPTAR